LRSNRTNDNEFAFAPTTRRASNVFVGNANSAARSISNSSALVWALPRTRLTRSATQHASK
jgi:hypothetical protein